MNRGVQPNPKPDQPEQPARTQTGNRPNRPLRWSVTGFHAQDPTPAGWVAGFLLQYPSHPTRPTLYTYPAIFGEIQARFGEIRQHLRRSKRDLDHIWWDSARFEEIQVDFGNFWCRSTGFLQIPENFLKISATIWCIFAQILWVFQKSGDDLMFFFLRSSDFCTNLAKIRWKIQIAIKMESSAASSSTLIDSIADQTTPIRPNSLVFAVGGRFSRRKLDVISSVPSWAQTWPGPTHGHP